MKPKRIVFIDRNFITDRYPNKPNDGDSFFTYGWGSEYARKFKKQNAEWVVECWKADGRISETKSKTIEGVEYKMFPAIHIPTLGYLSNKMIKYLKQDSTVNKLTIYNISSFDHLLFYTLASKMKDLPLVVQNHGESTLKYKFKHRNPLKNILRFFLIPFERNAFKNIDLLYVLDKEIINWIPKTSSEPKLKVSTVGVDIEIFQPVNKAEARSYLNLEQNKKYLIYVGRLNNTKSPNLLISAYTKLKNEMPELELILVGNQSGDTFYQEAKQCGAIVHGVIPQKELKFWLSAADIYYLPKYSDNHSFGGIGMLPVQSILCNTPVIGNSLKNFPEEDLEKVGLLSDSVETIIQSTKKVFSNINRYSNIRFFAQKHYAWENIIRACTQDFILLLDKYDK